MIAIFKTGGKQYIAQPGQILKVEKIKGKKGDNLSFNHILAISDGKDNTIGTPLVKGALIEAKILDQIRDKKIIVFKKKRRKNYRLTQGHRQYLTVLKIETISKDSKKSTAKSIKQPIKTKSVDTIQTKDTKKANTKEEKKPIVKMTNQNKIDKKKKIIKKTVAKKSIKSKK